MTLAAKPRPNLQDYASRIVMDERWGQLEQELQQELFDRWCEELDATLRKQIHLEYLGFKLFSSKLKALAAQKLLRETDKS